MRKGFVAILLGIFFIINSSSHAYQIATSFVFPIQGYSVNDGCLEWGEYNEKFPGKRHVADDYCCSVDTEVKAIGKGRVKYVLNDPNNSTGSGWYGVIVVEHQLNDGSKICSVYGHVKPVTSISAGTEIGDHDVTIGKVIEYPPSSDHIHFGIYNNQFGAAEGTYPSWLHGYLPEDDWPGKYLDPIAFIESHKSPVVDLNNGLVAYYPFNGNAKDESGTGNNGTVHGATLTSDRFGNASQAYLFDGTDDWIEVPNHESLNPPAVTVSAWFRLHQFSSTEWGKWRTLVMKENSKSSNNHYYCIYTDKERNLQVNTYPYSGQKVLVNSKTELELNRWYHVVGIYDCNELKQYLNGVFQGSAATEFPLDPGNKHLCIGYSGFWCGWYWDGVIDEVRIYNRALSEFEINKLYENTYVEMPVGYKTVQENHAQIDQGKIHWWDFVNDAVQKILVKLGFGSTFNVKIYRPDGTLYSEQQSDTSPIEISIPNAQAGQWRFEVTAIETPEPNDPYALVVGTEIPCPDCSGVTRTIENVTFLSDCLCECNCSESLTLGAGVTVEDRATVTFTAPIVKIEDGTHFEEGCKVTINQE